MESPCLFIYVVQSVDAFMVSWSSNEITLKTLVFILPSVDHILFTIPSCVVTSKKCLHVWHIKCNVWHEPALVSMKCIDLLTLSLTKTVNIQSSLYVVSFSPHTMSLMFEVFVIESKALVQTMVMKMYTICIYMYICFFQNWCILQPLKH